MDRDRDLHFILLVIMANLLIFTNRVHCYPYVIYYLSNLFFASANIVPNALLFKDKEFKFIAYRSLFVQCIGGIIAILAAISGAGLYALIINPIFSSILIFIISIRKKPQKLKYTFGSKSIHEIFSYSAYQFMLM